MASIWPYQVSRICNQLEAQVHGFSYPAAKVRAQANPCRPWVQKQKRALPLDMGPKLAAG